MTEELIDNPQASEAAAPQGRGIAFWLIAILLAAVLLYFSLRGVDWARVGGIVASARRGFLLLAGCVMSLTFVLRALRWRIVLNANERLPVLGVFSANMAGYLGNSFLPARAGEVFRSVLISRSSSLTKTYVLTTALSERLLDVIALVLASSVILLNVESKPVWIDALSGFTGFAAAAGAIAIAVLPHIEGRLEGVLRWLPGPERLRARAMDLAHEVFLGLRAFHSAARMAGFASLTVLIWSGDAVNLMLLARALDLSISFSVAVLLLTGFGLASSLPSTPGYIGIYQFVAVTVLAGFGVSREGALAFSVVVQAAGYVVIVALGLPALLRLRRMSRNSSLKGVPVV
jgi:glycosyltransferase 2 family protein